MTDEEFVAAIRETAESYKGNDPYSALAGIISGDVNSNSYIGTILREVYYGGTEKMQAEFDETAKDEFKAAVVAAMSVVSIGLVMLGGLEDSQWNATYPNAQPDVPGVFGWEQDITIDNGNEDDN